MAKNITFGGHAFSHPQLMGIDCLAKGLSQAEAGRQVGVSRNTIQNWLKKPEFKAAVKSKRQEEVEMKMLDADASTSLARQDYRSLAVRAVDIYKRSLSPDPDDRPDSSQLKAAKDIIDHAFGKAPFAIDHNVTGVVGSPKQEIIVQFNFWKSNYTRIAGEDGDDYIPPPTFDMVDDKKKRIIYNLPHYAKRFLYPHRRKSLKGGRGSAKSHTAAQIAIALMAGHLEPFGYPRQPYAILSARDHNVNLPRSVKKAVELYIKSTGQESDFKMMEEKTKHKNGSLIDYMGLSVNIDSLLSLEDYFILWIEQAEFLTDAMMEKAEPTMRKEIIGTDGNPISSEMWFIWNPQGRTNWVWREFETNEREPDDLHIEANYMDNPWWNETQDKARRRYKRNNPSRYEHVYMGVPDDGNTEDQILPYKLLKRCVEAYDKYQAIAKGTSFFDGGFDIAEGGEDQCCVVVRDGPCLEGFRMWRAQAGDLDLIAEDADHHIRELLGMSQQLWTLYYDGRHPMEGPIMRASNGRYMYQSVFFGGGVGGKEKLFDAKNLNGDMFERRNIQMAMALRIRVNKTIALLNGRDVYIPDCLFINPRMPDLESFIEMCTKPIQRVGPQTGKLQLDKRGEGGKNEKSPDQFDALCLAFARDSERGIRDF